MAPTFAGRGLQPGPTHRRDKRLDDKILTHLDNFKINPTYNTDGIGNWLRRARRTKVLLGCLPASRGQVSSPDYLVINPKSLCEQI